MNWYKTLSVHQRINLIVVCEDIVGVPYTNLRVIFTKVQIINIIHNKLQLDGFNV